MISGMRILESSGSALKLPGKNLSSSPMKKQRYRITFSKTDQMRFTGHLDLILTWERTFRRAALPLAYSEGYSPRPVLNLAAPLPLGYTSTGEIGDFWFSEIIPKDLLVKLLTNALPPGILLGEIIEITDIHSPKLPSLVAAASYQVELLDPDDNLDQKIAKILQSPRLIRTRKDKKYDLRPLILDLAQNSHGHSGQQLSTTLSMLPGATGRPDQVLEALGILPARARICRTEIMLENRI